MPPDGGRFGGWASGGFRPNDWTPTTSSFSTSRFGRSCSGYTSLDAAGSRRVPRFWSPGLAAVYKGSGPGLWCLHLQVHAQVTSSARGVRPARTKRGDRDLGNERKCSKPS